MRERKIYISKPMPNNWKRDDEALLDILMLTDFAATPEAIAGWTDEEAWLAEDYAARAYTRASDNLNRVPQIPHHVMVLGYLPLDTVAASPPSEAGPEAP